MTDPVTITTATIVALAASKFVEAAAKKAGELASATVLTQAGKQIDTLWTRIKQYFAGNQRAEAAIAQVEIKQSESALTKLAVYLDDELSDSENQLFAQELRQLAQEIVNIQNQSMDTVQQQNTNYGRDQYNFGRFEGDNTRFGGS